MHFEWDRAKAERNVKRHRVSFDEAVTVFYDPLAATFDDPDHPVSEHRLIVVLSAGRAARRLTTRSTRTRAKSARPG